MGRWMEMKGLETQTTICEWLFQLDDKPNLWIENGCLTKHPFLTGWLWGFQARGFPC